ncbi:MAG: FtsW/RodA/SpoVE family cell cycle protein [Clostridia bacterium]|nr:FtsW/RodA/SpoVE family cell cycle protein [Clostridia bacterium]
MKQKKRRNPIDLLTGVMQVFFFAAFFLLFLKDWSVEALVMAFAVPALLYLTGAVLPRLFPMDKLLLALINFLCALGILLQFRYSASRGFTQAFNYALGLVAMIGCSLMVRHIRSWKLLTVPMMLASCGLLALPFVFRAANAGKGATAWVGFGSMTMQPSELVKILYVLILSFLLSRRRVVTSMIFIGVMLGFLVLQRDLGTAAIYAGTGLVLLYAATHSKLLTGGILAGAAGGISVMYLLFRDSYFLTVQNRINNWLDPFATYDKLGGGYQIVQSLIAIANGGWWGTGLGLGSAEMIPEFRTDFIFSALMNEFGLVFAALILCVYMLIVLRSADIALRSASAFHALLSTACAAAFALQTFIIIGGITKLIPMTGVTVPFLSYGGTSIVSCMALMGLIQGTAGLNEHLLKEDRRLADTPGEGAAL